MRSYLESLKVGSCRCLCEGVTTNVDIMLVGSISQQQQQQLPAQAPYEDKEKPPKKLNDRKKKVNETRKRKFQKKIALLGWLGVVKWQLHTLYVI